MFKYLLANTIFDVVYVVCVTVLAIYFNAHILSLWYLLVLVTGYKIKKQTRSEVKEND